MLAKAPPAPVATTTAHLSGKVSGKIGNVAHLLMPPTAAMPASAPHPTGTACKNGKQKSGNDSGNISGKDTPAAHTATSSPYGSKPHGKPTQPTYPNGTARITGKNRQNNGNNSGKPFGNITASQPAPHLPHPNLRNWLPGTSQVLRHEVPIACRAPTAVFAAGRSTAGRLPAHKP